MTDEQIRKTIETMDSWERIQSDILPRSYHLPPFK